MQSRWEVAAKTEMEQLKKHRWQLNQTTMKKKKKKKKTSVAGTATPLRRATAPCLDAAAAPQQLPKCERPAVLHSVAVTQVAHAAQQAPSSLCRVVCNSTVAVDEIAKWRQFTRRRGFQ